MKDMEMIQGIIRDRCHEIRSITDAARMINVCPETLRKEFVRKTGITLSRAITVARVERAKDLLKHSDHSCTAVTLIVGFSREEVGFRAFKRFTGQTMQQYRNAFSRPSPSPAKITH